VGSSRATTSPALTRVPRSTLISASRPATFMPSTTRSSAASVPAATTTPAARSSVATETRTGVLFAVVSARAVPAGEDFSVPVVG
jgi:hypothetical protein